MTGKPTEEKIEAFDRLARQAAQLHELTWCMKRQWPRYTAGLKGRECLCCPEHVLNGGVCDPL